MPCVREVVSPASTPGFAAFLDGTQESRVFTYVARGVPVIHGKVAAVVRIRSDRRMATWRHDVAQRLYAPRRLLSQHWNDALDALPIDVRDISAAPDANTSLIEHPFALRDAAIHEVQADRERAEHRLAEQWCDGERATAVHRRRDQRNRSRGDERRTSVGVVKNHRTLYAEGGWPSRWSSDSAKASERACFASRRRSGRRVASWYLRLRDPAGRDPMWGLVRVEIADSAVADDDIRRRADEVSRWILAEVSPLALPDARWDKMVYGIRDCEEFSEGNPVIMSQQLRRRSAASSRPSASRTRRTSSISGRRSIRRSASARSCASKARIR